MAKEKRKHTLEDIQSEAQKELSIATRNFSKANLANFALRQINRVDVRELNLVFTDKPFLKKNIESINKIDGIYSRLMAQMGDPGLPDNLREFQELIRDVETAYERVIDAFFAKGIGQDRDIKAWKAAQAEKESGEQKTQEEIQTEEDTKEETA